jgi:hypothetical protein
VYQPNLIGIAFPPTEFIDENGGGPGVRLRKWQITARIDQLSGGQRRESRWPVRGGAAPSVLLLDSR